MRMPIEELEQLCEDLNRTFDEPVSPQYGNGELVVYLPLDEGNEPDPADIDDRVIDYLASHGYNARLDVDGTAVVAEY